VMRRCIYALMIRRERFGYGGSEERKM